MAFPLKYLVPLAAIGDAYERLLRSAVSAGDCDPSARPAPLGAQSDELAQSLPLFFVCYIRAIDRVLRDGKLLERLLTFANRIRDSVRNFSFFEQLKISISSSTLFLITEDISAVTSHWESSQHCLLPAGHLDPSPPSRTILPRLCRRRRLSCHPLSQSQIHGEACRR